jgi:hypothetical protein
MSVNVYSGSAIPALRLHVTISTELHGVTYQKDLLSIVTRTHRREMLNAYEILVGILKRKGQIRNVAEGLFFMRWVLLVSLYLEL